MIEKVIENEIKLSSAIGLDGALVVSVTNFPLSSIEELFKNKLMGISRGAEPLETRKFRDLGYKGDGANLGDPMRIRQSEYGSDDHGIFENSRDIMGGGYPDGTTTWVCGTTTWVCQGDYKGNGYHSRS